MCWAVKGCRKVTKADMVLNDATPEIEVDPETYVVLAVEDQRSEEHTSELQSH